MNYVTHYDRLMNRARGRSLVGYRERHHVLPKCMGGGNEPENLVELTAEEHYVAHQLLVKLYPGHVGIAFSAIYMASRGSGNKAYGWLRHRLSLAMRGNKRTLGRKWSEEQRAKMRLRTHSEATLQKMSESQRGRTFSEETRAKMSAAKKGKPATAQQLRNLQIGRSGPRSADHRAKIAKAHIGMRYSDETREKLSEIAKRRTYSPETRARMSASKRESDAARIAS